jgi:hypothetical protein
MRPHALAAVLLVGCATQAAPPAVTPAAPAAPAAEKELPIPPEFRGHIDDAESMGRALYRQDKVSAIGTDVLLEKLGSLDGKGLGGFLTIQQRAEDGSLHWLVSFFTRQAPPRIAYRVRVFLTKGHPPELDTVDPPEPVSATMGTLIRARQTAIDELMRVERPRQPINPAVMPGSSLHEKGILIYLLAGTTRPNVAVMGKHHRVLLSEDGSQVVRFEPMTRSILEMPLGVPAGARPAALVITHSLTEWPLETHVFASLLYHQTIYVGTSRHLWKVDGAHITLIENR